MLTKLKKKGVIKMEKISEKDLKQKLKKINHFRKGAYITFKGIIDARITFHALHTQLDEEKHLILLEDNTKDDTMSIDLNFVSNIEISKDSRNLKFQIENDVEQSIIIKV